MHLLDEAAVKWDSVEITFQTLGVAVRHFLLTWQGEISWPMPCAASSAYPASSRIATGDLVESRFAAGSTMGQRRWDSVPAGSRHA